MHMVTRAPGRTPLQFVSSGTDTRLGEPVPPRGPPDAVKSTALSVDSKRTFEWRVAQHAPSPNSRFRVPGLERGGAHPAARGRLHLLPSSGPRLPGHHV